MKVADLFALLSIKTDKSSVKGSIAQINKVEQSLHRLALAGVGAAAGVLKLISDTASTASKFKGLESEIGVSSQAMQGFAFAAETTGLELDNVVDFIGDLSEKAVEASEGNKDLRKEFRKLGLQIKDSNGHIKDAETLTLDAADAFSKLEDGPKKTQLAMKLFSDEGRKMIPLLNEGSEGINALRDEFAELGGQISEEDTKALGEFSGEVKRIKTVLIGVRNQAVIAILPHLKRMSKAFLLWVKANKVLIKQKLASAMKTIAFALKILGKAFMFLLKHGEDMLKFWIAFKVAVLLAAGAVKFMAMVSTLASAKMFAAWMQATLPLVLMALLLAAITLAIIEVVETFQGKQTFLRDFWDAIVQNWREDIISFGDWLQAKVDKWLLITDDFTSLFSADQSKREKIAERKHAEFQKSIGVTGRAARTSAVNVAARDQSFLRELEDPNFGNAVAPQTPTLPGPATDLAGSPWEHAASSQQFGDVNINVNTTESGEAVKRAMDDLAIAVEANR